MAKDFEELEPGGSLGGAEGQKPGGAAGISHAGSERRFRTDDDEVSLLAKRQGNYAGNVVLVAGHVADSPAIARSRDHPAYTQRLGQLPPERVFAPAPAGNQHNFVIRAAHDSGPQMLSKLSFSASFMLVASIASG